MFTGNPTHLPRDSRLWRQVVLRMARARSVDVTNVRQLRFAAPFHPSRPCKAKGERRPVEANRAPRTHPRLKSLSRAWRTLFLYFYAGPRGLASPHFQRNGQYLQ